jgi:hypothetical protein
MKHGCSPAPPLPCSNLIYLQSDSRLCDLSGQCGYHGCCGRAARLGSLNGLRRRSSTRREG